mgnify:FL=1|jgi:hypothetical protein
MADQFENQLPQKSDAKWVRALDASGNPILISKEDLASVVGGLLGLSGIDIRQFINTVPTAGKLSIFSNIDKGIVLVSILETGMIGKYDALISIIDRNNIRVESYNVGQDSDYQIFAINDGVLSISNSGYGIGKFIAYYFG